MRPESRIPCVVGGAFLFAQFVAMAAGVDSGSPRPLLGNDMPDGWSSWGGGPGGMHFSAAYQITTDNVPQLAHAWTHRSGDIRVAGERGSADIPPTQSSFQATPILVGDTLYYCSPFNKVFAVDARTGEERWAFDPEIDRASPVLPNCRGVSAWQSGREGRCESRILFGTLDARLFALDANSGARCEDFGDRGEVDLTEGLNAHNPSEYGVTQPPAIIGDKLIVGSMVLDNIREDVPSGVVRAFDVRSGALRWAWEALPPGAQAEADGSYRPGTANVWSMISVDEARDMVFAPTGNAAPDFFGGQRDGLDYYASSLVALRGSTGELLWHYRFVNHDIWDYDTPSQPTLIDLPIEGEVVPAVVQTTKMGLTFVLHRETGEPLWPVEERAVPVTGGVPEERPYPTQPFPTHVPSLFKPVTPDDAWGFTFWDKNICRERLAALDNQGLYTPPSLNGSIQMPSTGGGNNWGSPAIDPKTGVMVVYTNRTAGQVKLKQRAECQDSMQPQLGTPYCVEVSFAVTSPLGTPCTAPPWGTLDVIDLVAGKQLWSVPLGTTRNLAPFPFWWIEGLPGMAAPMMTAGGLVFSGIANDHHFRAFDLRDGRELWKEKLPTAAVALPMSYQLDGRQYVVVAVGGHWSGGSPPGDYLMAFALPEAP